MISENYCEKVYAGFLGMNIGIRLGSPVEPVSWTYRRIREVYGEIRGYVRDYKNFAADDDLNGPVYFIRALYDDAAGRELRPEDVGRAWLNYTREGIGMFWWGGFGVSTEQTAFQNLLNGISPPESGSAEQNGLVTAEQIGGQIFIDTWGLVLPGNPRKAGKYAAIAASVSHDGNGLHGARFIAGCISAAFGTGDVSEIMAEGLSLIPTDSTYALVVKDVLRFHEEHPDDFRACREFLEENWGYDKYGGACHIIPNAGVCALALAYSDGDFARGVEIAAMCGWDTDCNAGNVGTILGVACGVSGLPTRYRRPINDFLAASGVSGYLNIIDAPSAAKELALLGYRLGGEEAPEELRRSCTPEGITFDFNLPGSTHGFRVSGETGYRISIAHAEGKGVGGSGALEILFDRITSADGRKVYYKPFYRRADFDDEHYSPTFAPRVYSGQTVRAKIYPDQWEGAPVQVIPYVRVTCGAKEIRFPRAKLVNHAWNDVAFIVPDTKGSFVDEIGFQITTAATGRDRSMGRLYIDDFRVNGKSRYAIDFSKQAREFSCITPFSHNRGEWNLCGSRMERVSEGDCGAYTGNYYMKDLALKAPVTPVAGKSHCVIFRARGIRLGYLAGFDGENRVSLILNNHGYRRIASCEFHWEPGREYLFEVSAAGSRITFSIDGEKLIDTTDDTFGHGMIGFGSTEMGRTYFGRTQVAEL